MLSKDDFVQEIPRRAFLQSTALIAGLSLGARAQSPPQGMPPREPVQPAVPLRSASELQVPKMKFGKVEISRLIVGCNPSMDLRTTTKS
jgi:hypothetical protein